jgi:leucyl/phenylalanyl-tRNA--protein transferase
MIPWLAPDDPFPPVARSLAEPSGLLAASGHVDADMLVRAYAHGIFPWYSEPHPVLWWSPDPRMVLHAAEFKLSRSLAKTLRRFVRTPGCELRIDGDFRAVIQACAGTPREGQGGTWIVPQMVQAYVAWHRLGRAHSFETWVDGRLVGGLYGVGIGRMFYGESMFSWRTDASKIALAALAAFCRAHGIDLIDCQQHTRHLASFGACEIPRAEFERHLGLTLGAAPPRRWTYDRALWAQLGLEAEAAHAEARA